MCLRPSLLSDGDASAIGPDKAVAHDIQSQVWAPGLFEALVAVVGVAPLL